MKNYVIILSSGEIKVKLKTEKDMGDSSAECRRNSGFAAVRPEMKTKKQKKSRDEKAEKKETAGDRTEETADRMRR